MVSAISMRHALFLLCAIVAAAALVLVGLGLADKQAGAATDQLPDLRMVKPGRFQITNCTDTTGDCAYAGQRQLRFKTTIVNVGNGPFEVQGSNRDSTGVLRTVTQHIFDDTGNSRSVATKVGNDGSTAQMYYAGDVHNHWHVKNLEYYSLSSSPVLTGAKEGFCFADNTKWFKKDANGNPVTPGVPSKRVYSACANNQPNATSVTVGLSKGWGDVYGTSTHDQYIDITGLPDGTYRLTNVADKQNWFYETNDSNNTNWVDLNIQGNQVSVTGSCKCDPPKV